MRTNLRSFLVVVVLTTLLLMGMPSNDRNGASDALTTDNTGPDDINEISGAVHSQATLMKKIPDVSQRTQTANGDERTLIENDGNLYYIYSWYNTSKTGDPITVSIVSSPDGGDTWTSNIDIWDSTFYEDCLFKHLMVWKGDLYAFYGGFHSSRTYRTCYMKKTPINNWKGLTSATQLTIRSIQAQSWKVDHDDNYIYMSMIRASQWDTWFYRYDGSSWTSGTVLSNPGSAGQSSI
ncbi:MAG: hypothetical protein U9R75_11845, partial [Candidatus Thermoplasmatota archaeon]|nr:hypothetical protein [Candidatus Thermoplasmatota archaeon]